MRLSDVLSKPPDKEYVQIDAFLQNKAGKVGQKVDISTGTVALNYFCVSCGDIRTFCSSPKLTCIFVSKNLISVDCVLTCGCGASIPVWFLIESKNDITGQAPTIRILKKSVKLSDMVRINDNRYGEFTPLISPFDRVLCFSWLGAGRQYPNNALGCVPARLEMDSYQKGAIAHVKQSYF